jgi:hypothetical protein
MTLRDFMKGHNTAKIYNLYNNALVRILTVRGDALKVETTSDLLEIPLDTELVYQAWDCDRGSILFKCPPGNGAYSNEMLKLCTEFDPVEFPNGTRERATHPGSYL